MRAAKYWGDGLAAAWRRKELDGKGPVLNIMLDVNDCGNGAPRRCRLANPKWQAFRISLLRSHIQVESSE